MKLGWLDRRVGKPDPLLCIGHSHVACVARAAETAGIPLTALNFWEMPGAILRDGDVPRLTPSLEQQLREHRGPVFSMVGGAAHGVLGMLVHPRRFDFVLPTQPELPLDPAAELLPALVVRRVLESMMAEYLALMLQIRRLCSGPMFHIESPPPYADAVRMHADVPWGMYPGMCQEISPAPFRYKLWRLHSQIVGEWCDGAAVAFVTSPPASIDEAGFMREPYYGDGAHANAAYGELVLEQMRRLA
ncbi:hypothetical protein [Rhodanobacter sp. C05]|uniref:hypothetical protein n=1 Tax=Rhodanobacter sp. C05 TaxID=1945855 RepID=UPI00098462B1|nr:hypothetical protein [Rhodanobacter sp. C05]OOG37413.1 hypothetical protein B0E51_16290 [Rhodanobacter sp. C05]